MLKTVIGLLSALFVFGFPLAYAQDASSPVPSQTDFKVLTDARIGIVKAALQLTPEQEKMVATCRGSYSRQSRCKVSTDGNGSTTTQSGG